MRNLFFILFVALLLLGYGIKLYKHIQMLNIEKVNFETAVQCVRDLESGKTKVCD